MKNNHEDELLRPLFGKIRMKNAPDNITSKVMDRIMVNPEMEPVLKYYFDWWWYGVGLLSLAAIYFTGVFNILRDSISPWFIEVYLMFAGYLQGISALLPSNIIVIPTSFLLPVLFAGALMILFLDVLLRHFIRKYSY